MATKRHELAGLKASDIAFASQNVETEGCLAKADLDEPLFILRAADRCAPAAVRDWARRATGAGCPAAKVQEAMEIASEMEAWQMRTGRAKWPD